MNLIRAAIGWTSRTVKFQGSKFHKLCVIRGLLFAKVFIYFVTWLCAYVGSIHFMCDSKMALFQFLQDKDVNYTAHWSEQASCYMYSTE